MFGIQAKEFRSLLDVLLFVVERKKRDSSFDGSKEWFFSS